MYKYTFCGLRESILIIRKRESVECQWLVCLSDELIRKYGLVHPECLRSAFYSLYLLFWASEQAFLYRETVRSDRRKSLYRSMEKAFLQSCFLIIVMHVMLSGWLSGLYRIVGILVYMRACGCLVAYNVLSWGLLCIIMQSVDGFSLSGIWHQTSTGWHVAVMNFGLIYTEDKSVCIGQKDRIWLRQWCGRQIRIVPSIVYLSLVF